MTTEGIVYVTQENQGLDYTPAEAFGNVQFMTRKEWSPIRGSLINQEIVREIRYALKNFNPVTDFFVVTGSPTIAALVFLLVGKFAPADSIRMLRWSNRDRNYQLVTLEP